MCALENPVNTIFLPPLLRSVDTLSVVAAGAGDADIPLEQAGKLAQFRQRCRAEYRVDD